ncbi:hypothetical protein T439DRAFT_346787 [Meredithblackwellia eburnea MCA 4105]
MAAVCTTLAGSQAILTVLSTVTETVTVTTTGAPSTITTNVPVATTICPDPVCQTGSNSTTCSTPACTTSEVTQQVVSTIPGTVATSTNVVQNVVTSLSTSLGASITSCTTSQITSPTSSTRQTTAVTTPTTTGMATSRTNTASSTQSGQSVEYSTFYSTLIVTDSSGRVTTSTVPVPTLLNKGGSSSGSSSNTGAIAGGVVGGVVALALAVFLVWWLKKKGVFSRDDDERLEDDYWRPRPHTPGVMVGSGVVDGGGDHEGDELGTMMREKEEGQMGGRGNSLGHGSRRSWYGGGEGNTGHYQDPRRASSGGGSDMYPYNGQPGPDYGPMPTSHHHHQHDNSISSSMYSGQGPQGQMLTHRHSVQSQYSSGGGHDSFSNRPSPASYNQPLPDMHQSLSDNRLASMAYYGSDEGARGGDGRREELVTRAASPGSDHSDSARTAATTGSSVGYSGQGLRGLASMTPMPTLDSRRASGGALLRGARPSLEVLTSGRGSGSDSSGTMLSSVLSAGSASTGGTSIPSPTEKPTPVQRRTSLRRSNSDDSLLPPSQFLGARVVNATPAEERTGFDLANEKSTLDIVREHTPTPITAST